MSQENKTDSEEKETIIPSIIGEAIRRICKDEETYASHRINGKEPPKDNDELFLKNDNHALYIGKCLYSGGSDDVKDIVGIKTYRGIYSEDFIAVCLDYLSAHLSQEPGQKIKIVVGRLLSELFNGKDDVKKALTMEEQRKKILRIAQRKCGLKSEQLDIVDPVTGPRHSELFKKLKQCIDPQTGVVEAQKAFSTEKEEKAVITNSFGIAQILFKAAEEDERLNNALIACIPEHLKKDATKEQLDQRKCYGLTEIAMRIADFMDGTYIHACMPGQVNFNQIIGRLLQGKKGCFKGIKSLHPLFDVLPSTPFHTIHIDNRQNPRVHERNRIIARARLAVAVILGASALTGSYECGRYMERTQNQQVDVREKAPR